MNLTDLPIIPEEWSVTHDAYHADRLCESSSTIKRYDQDRYHYYLTRVLGQPRKEYYSLAMAIGTALHCLVLTPELYEDQIVYTDCSERTKEFKELLKSAKAEQTLVPAAHKNKVREMADAINSNPRTSQGVEGNLLPILEGKCELSVRCRDGELGLGLKAKFDFLDISRGRIVDLKTTRVSRPSDIAGEISRYDYLLSAALYTELAEKMLAREVEYYWVFVTSGERPECFVFKPRYDTLMQARHRLRHILEDLSQRLARAGDESAWHTRGWNEIHEI